MFKISHKNFIQYFCNLNKKFNNQSLFKKNKILNNNKGMAVLETIPLLVVFMVLMTYAMGFWGSIHAGILHSIAARTYAFETFRNRSHLTQFRERGAGSEKFYSRSNLRFHGINNGDRNQFTSSRRVISFSNFEALDESTGLEDQGADRHADITAPLEGSSRGPTSAELGRGFNPIWIQIGYGYCFNLECGPK